jgi:hypothetical protein
LPKCDLLPAREKLKQFEVAPFVATMVHIIRTVGRGSKIRNYASRLDFIQVLSPCVSPERK